MIRWLFADPKYHIVPIAENRAHELAEIHKACFPLPWDETVMRGFLLDPRVVAYGAQSTRRTRLVGAILIRSAGGEADILTICVLPAYRGHGIGADLCRAAMGTLRQRGVQALFLEVAEDNAPAIRLYEKLGFTEVGRRKAYYAARQAGQARDALIMRLDLR